MTIILLKNIVQPGDISNAPTEKCLENVGHEFENCTLTWTPGLDICEGNKLIMPLKRFISNVRYESDQKQKEYQDAAIKLSPKVEIEYSDVAKRRLISKFPDKSTEKAVYGTDLKATRLLLR
ncbi:hypothetical protein TNCV_4282941 [Trichonephila clavipes]|nr:hypothetical protein TNCV_4282941 [Trichonephila clavipes]